MSSSSIVQHPELSLSSLSLSSSSSFLTSSEDLDWDRSQSDIDVSAIPSTPPRNAHRRARSNSNEETPVSTRHARSLAELLNQHAEKTSDGYDMHIVLSPTEERVLEEELRNWINSDCSPYEVDNRRQNGALGTSLLRTFSLGGRSRSDTVTLSSSPNLTTIRVSAATDEA